MDSSTGMLAILMALLCCCVFLIKAIDVQPIILDSETISEEVTQLECKVSKLYTGEDVQTKTNMNFGYAYTSDGMAYGVVPSNDKIVVTEYFVVLTDSENISILFKVDAATYGLLSEGQTISIKLLNCYTNEGEQYGDTKFYWENSEFDFAEYVTNKIQTTNKE